MVETLFQRDIKIKRVTTLGYSAAQALNDPVRIKILEILSHVQMCAEEITKTLGSSGYKKATTTIRHHLDTLKSAGLIQATKMVEVRGAVMKYYSPTLRAFSYDLPDLEKHVKLVDDTEILAGVVVLHGEHPAEVKRGRRRTRVERLRSRLCLQRARARDVDARVE